MKRTERYHEWRTWYLHPARPPEVILSSWSVKEAIENGGGDGAIAVEDRGPLFKGFVGGDDRTVRHAETVDRT